MLRTEKFVAENMRHALNTIRDTLGPEAVIITTRRHPRGVEVEAGIEENSEIVNMTEMMSHVERSAALLVTENQTDSVKKEIQLLRQLIESQNLKSISNMDSEQRVENLLIQTKLQQLNLPKCLCGKIASAIKSTDFVESWNEAKALLKQSIITTQKDIIAEPGVHAFIGTTGVGKTLTVAKLATRFALSHDVDELGLITADCQRAAAKDQLWSYGRILGASVASVSDQQQLQKALEKMSDKKLILIDTSGVGQNDQTNLTKLQELLVQQDQKIEYHLALAAHCQEDALWQIVKKFSAYPLSDCLITKFDECAQLSSLLGVLMYSQLAISYISDGQRIPDDLHLADQQLLYSYLLREKELTTTHTVDQIEAVIS